MVTTVQSIPSVEALEREYPDLSTFGRYAVKNNLSEAKFLTGSYKLEPDNEEVWTPDEELKIAANYADTRDKDVVLAREELSQAVRDENRQIIGNQLASQTLPEWLAHSIGFDRRRGGLALLRRLAVEGAQRVDDPRLVYFLEWHRVDMLKRQHDFNRLRVPGLKADYLKRLRYLVKYEGLPRVALSDANQRRLHEAKVYLDDGSGTLLEYGSGEDYVTNGITIDDMATGKIYTRLRPRFSVHTRLHELTHIMEGRSEGETDANFGKGVRRLFRGYSTETDGMVRLNEIVTDHIASALHRGGIDDMDLLSPRREGILYPNYQLLNTICKSGIKPIDVRLFVAAHFDNSPKSVETLKEALSKAYPKRDIIASIAHLNVNSSRAVVDFSRELRRENRVQRIARRIASPVPKPVTRKRR